MPDVAGESRNLGTENWPLNLAALVGSSLVASTRANLEEVWNFPNFPSSSGEDKV